MLGVERLKRQGVLVPLLLLALVFILPGLFALTLGLPRALRVAISGTILIPLGAMLGVFFPLGMLRFGDRDKPWYWAINGVFGVVASVLSLALSMEIGFAAVGVLAAFGYAVAWACLHGTEVPSSVEAVMEVVEEEGPTAIGSPGGSREPGPDGPSGRATIRCSAPSQRSPGLLYNCGPTSGFPSTQGRVPCPVNQPISNAT